MRHFVCLPVPEDARDDLADFLAPRRRAEPDLRWTAPERWHLTLAFLPDVADVDLDDLVDRLATACARRRPLSLGLRGGGTFGGGRVIWADIAASPPDREELGRLATGVRNAAAAAGTVVEGGRFSPHVTLARAPRPRDMRHLIDVLDLYGGPTWEAGEVHLVASHLGRGPVRHELVEVFALGKPDRSETESWWRRPGPTV